MSLVDLITGDNCISLVSGMKSIKKCPEGFVGEAQRMCTLRDVNQPEWDLPDFSSCFARVLHDIHDNVSIYFV